MNIKISNADVEMGKTTRTDETTVKMVEFDEMMMLASKKEITSEGISSKKPLNNPSVSFIPVVTNRWGTNKTAYLAFQTLGIIYGDIGTSPLYTFSTIFTTQPKPEDVLGALSVMIWTLILVFIIKYVACILLADDHGEGGTFALFSKLRRHIKMNMAATPESGKSKPWYKFQGFLLIITPILSAIGVAAILSDGILTPAISVLGAIQGITIVSPNLSQNAVVGITCAILVLLYLVQFYGTGRITDVFSPIIVIWFFALIIIGANNIAQYPHVLSAFNPGTGFAFFIRNKEGSWVSLGAIFLTVTGSEALYADLGHFNAKSIRLTAIFFVLPSLLICYCGQAARLIVHPPTYTSTFYLSMPHQVLIPMVILSTLAAIIASQAIITATFSLVSQATQLGFFPRLTVKYTSRTIEGRVYVPEVNYFYMVLVVAVVAGYRNATALGYAYGVAVSLVFFITTLFYTIAIIECFHKPWYVAILFLAVYSLIDLSFLTSNLLKFVTGGWFTVTITVIIASAMLIWRFGRLQMLRYQTKHFEPLQSIANDGTPINAVTASAVVPASATTTTIAAAAFAESEHSPETRNCGTLICYTSNLTVIPAAYSHLHHNFSIKPQQFVFINIKPANSPFVVGNATATQMSGNVFLIIMEYGYCNNIPTYERIRSVVAKVLQQKGKTLNNDTIVNLVGVDALEIDSKARIHKRFFYTLFKAIHSISTSIVYSFNLPHRSTVAVENFIELQ